MADVGADAELAEDVVPVPLQVLAAPEFARDADEVAIDGENFSHA
jgi:hypothetical protein